MALTDPDDTLSFHQSRVLAQHRDMSAVPCGVVAKHAVNFAKTQGKGAVPETEALWFYAMNHGVALISAKKAPLEPLPKWEKAFVDAYYGRMAEKATRAFYYLVRICTREARHCKNFSVMIPKVEAQFGPEVAKFFSTVKGGEEGIWEGFVSNPPNVGIGHFCKALQFLFYKGGWTSGYGGKAWGAVTDCLVRYVTGEFSAEMMLDTIWTLSHNNGPIFNKSWLYVMYTHDIMRLLDVQRSGQIPAACLTDDHLIQFVPPDLKKFMTELKERFPNDVKDYVDWEVVEALGSVSKYPKEKQKQNSIHGFSPAALAAKAANEAKMKIEAEAAAKKAAEHAENWFQVMPNLEVEKVKRAA